MNRSAALAVLMGLWLAAGLLPPGAGDARAQLPPAKPLPSGAKHNAVCGGSTGATCQPPNYCTSAGMGDDATNGICCLSSEEPYVAETKRIVLPNGNIGYEFVWRCKTSPKSPQKPPAPACPPGYKLEGWTCVPKDSSRKPLAPCPAGKERVANVCEDKCPPGTDRLGHKCIAKDKPGNPDALCIARGGKPGQAKELDKDGKPTGKIVRTCDTSNACAKPGEFLCQPHNPNFQAWCCRGTDVCHPEGGSNNYTFCQPN